MLQTAPRPAPAAPPAARSLRRALGTSARLAFLTVLFILLVLPLIAVIIGAFRSTSPLSPGGEWTLAAFPRALGEILSSGALANSILLAVASTVIGTAIATVFALISEKTDLPLARWITPIMVVTLVISPMFYAMGYSLLASEYTGLINALARTATGSPELTLVKIESWPGLILLHSLFSSQVSYFLLTGSFARLDRHHEEAALVAGGTPATSLFRIDLPMLAPILSSVLLLGGLAGLQSFTVPLMLDVDIPFLLTQAYEQIAYQSPPRYADASVIGILLAIVTVALAFGRGAILRGAPRHTVSSRTGRTSRRHVRRHRWISPALVIAYLLLALVLPFATVIISSFTPYPGVYTAFSIEPYRRLFQNEAFGTAVQTTLGWAVVGGFLAVVIAFGIAVFTERGTGWIARTVAAFALIPIAVPGLVQAIGMTWAYASTPVLQKLYGTSMLVLIGLVASVLPVLVQQVRGALAQISPDLERAALVFGATPAQATLRVTIPLILPTLVAAWFLAAVFITGALEIPLLLGSAGGSNIASLSFSLFSGSSRSTAAALLTLIVLTIVITGSAMLLIRRALLRRAAVTPTTIPVPTQEAS